MSLCVNTGDSTWVLTAAVLVLGMMPGLAFFEMGLLRSRNSLSIISQVFLGIACLTTMWFLIGFSLVYGASQGGVIGNVKYALFLHMGEECLTVAPSIPAIVYAMFQSMFAAITPLLLTGAFAERVRIKGFLVLIGLWELLVYYPVAHWIFGDGWLRKLGALDFAGGIVIHTTAGVASIVCALILGRRANFDRFHGEFPPHSIPLAAVGASLLTMGWIGFNAGSALESGFLAAYTTATTMVAASSCAIVWSTIGFFRHGHVSTIEVMNGIISGLAGITPASGFIEPWAGFVMGILIGFSSYYFEILLKHTLRIDDSLSVSAVHGIPGVVGAYFGIAFFATKSVNPAGANGLFYGGTRLVWVQLVAILVAAAWTAFITFPIVWLLHNKTKWFSLKEERHAEGLDTKDHNATAYAQDYHSIEDFATSETLNTPFSVNVGSEMGASIEGH